MKNIVLIMALLALGLMSCTSCQETHQLPPTTTVDVSTTTTSTEPTTSESSGEINTATTLSLDNLSVEVPNDSWKLMENEVQTRDVSSYPYYNSFNNNIIVLGKEPFGFSYEDYVLSNLRDVKEAGGDVNASSSVEINGHQFALLETTQGKVSVWIWLTLVNNTGYAFSCGSPVSPEGQERICQQISKSIQIK